MAAAPPASPLPSRQGRAQRLVYLRSQVRVISQGGAGVCQALMHDHSPGWVEEALGGRNYNSAFQLAACVMRLGLQQVRLRRCAPRWR